jgi:hypothetical protein
MEKSMGQAKLKRRWVDEMLPYAQSGQILALHGSPLQDKPPMELAKVAAGHADVEELIAELRSGRLVHLPRAKFTPPASVETWLQSKAGLGPELMRELMVAHNDLKRASAIYPMPHADDFALEMDRLFFVKNTHRQLRVRHLVGAERNIGELNSGWTDRVITIQLDADSGIRSRFFFGCAEGSGDDRLDMDDIQIAELARRYARIG